MAPLNHGLDRGTTPFDDDLHATIRGVPDPAREVSVDGLVLGVDSEIHPLNSSRDPDVGAHAIRFGFARMAAQVSRHRAHPARISAAAMRPCRAR
jgi:hypothetical protein